MRAQTTDGPGTPTTALTSFTPGPDRGGSRRWRTALRTTPARIVVHGAVLVLLLVATAVVALRSATPATTLGERSASTAARTSVSAREIYTRLADTDVAASGLFLLADESRLAGLRGTYQNQVREVERSLNTSMGEAVEDPDRLARLAAIASRFQTYQQIVAAAQQVAAGGGGDSVAPRLLASAYARAASHYMADELLVAARNLREYDTRLLREARGDAGWWAAASVGTPLVTLAVLGAVQWWLWRRTRRRLNAGLLVASLSTLAVLGLTVASWSHWPEAEDRFQELGDTIEAQEETQERLRQVLAGRADLYLALGASVEPASHRRDFEDRGLCVAGSEEIGTACQGLAGVWAARQGDSDDAFTTAVGNVLDGPVGSSFTRRAETLTAELKERDQVIRAGVAALPAAPGQWGEAAAWLTLLAGAGVVLGLRQRLREYR